MGYNLFRANFKDINFQVPNAHRKYKVEVYEITRLV